MNMINVRSTPYSLYNTYGVLALNSIELTYHKHNFWWLGYKYYILRNQCLMWELQDFDNLCPKSESQFTSEKDILEIKNVCLLKALKIKHLKDMILVRIKCIQIHFVQMYGDHDLYFLLNCSRPVLTAHLLPSIYWGNIVYYLCPFCEDDWICIFFNGCSNSCLSMTIFVLKGLSF